MNPARMEEALRLIVGRQTREGKFTCEHVTTPGAIGDCERSGRTKVSEFTADRWCDACTAYWGLFGGFPHQIDGR